VRDPAKLVAKRNRDQSRDEIWSVAIRGTTLITRLHRFARTKIGRLISHENSGRACGALPRQKIAELTAGSRGSHDRYTDFSACAVWPFLFEGGVMVCFRS
jgi:hypothetical protein